MINVNPTTTTLYTLTVTDYYGYTGIDSVFVYVNDLPNFNIEDTAICFHDSLYINNDSNYTFYWSPATGVANILNNPVLFFSLCD